MDYDLTDSYDYTLPPELIADRPAENRAESRLMVGAEDGPRHLRFNQLPELLAPHDLVVFNDIRVVPARIHAKKQTGGAVELFVIDVLQPLGPQRWETSSDTLHLQCMTRSSKPVRQGQVLTAGSQEFVVLEANSGIATVRVEGTQNSAREVLEAVGEVPLPPYIVRRRTELGREAAQVADVARYQTVYARTAGAVAAPTAGLHFDADLLARLDSEGIERGTVSLEVGPGTFRPVTATRLSDHHMHTERYVIDAELGRAIEATRARGGRVVAVGTTTLRALESEALLPDAFSGAPRETNLFVSPGFQFRVVDALITNFHLPRSTLLALVYAFGGVDRVRAMYDAAVADAYRFYSYGDAMFLWRAQ